MNEIRAVRIEKIIIIEFIRGAGVQGDPVRLVTQYRSLEGELLAESDPEGRSLVRLPNPS